MEKRFTVIIVEDARLELKGTEEIFRTDVPEADIIGVASNCLACKGCSRPAVA